MGPPREGRGGRRPGARAAPGSAGTVRTTRGPNGCAGRSRPSAVLPSPGQDTGRRTASPSVGADPAITDAGLGDDETGVGGVIAELPAQLTDVDAQVVALRSVPASPHAAQQVLVGEELPGLGDELVEQRELRLGQVDDVAVEPHL